MGVQIKMPEQQQNSSMGRRLLGMAAPIAGGIFGGPAGAALGGMLGSKLNGGTTQDALLSGVQAGISTKAAPGKAAPVVGLDESSKLTLPNLGDSAMGRKLGAAAQNPMIATQEGLEALPHLEAAGHITNDQRKEYTGVLINAQNLASKKRF